MNQNQYPRRQQPSQPAPNPSFGLSECTKITNSRNCIVITVVIGITIVIVAGILHAFSSDSNPANEKRTEILMTISVVLYLLGAACVLVGIAILGSWLLIKILKMQPSYRTESTPNIRGVGANTTVGRNNINPPTAIVIGTMHNTQLQNDTIGRIHPSLRPAILSSLYPNAPSAPAYVYSY